VSRPLSWSPTPARAVQDREVHHPGRIAVATRYDKRDVTYQATAGVDSIRIWLRDPVP
jgi:hypothetical protein